ncbi:MAG: fibronectin type III domain-containing protein [Candidatus Paceibacterota bacterium]|jgi:hypothetical protein
MRSTLHTGLFLVIATAYLFGGVFFAHAATPISISLQPSNNSLFVSWTVPADATEQEVRYATIAIDEASFSGGTIVSGVPTPIPSVPQSVTINNLAENTNYFVGYRYGDTVGAYTYSFASLTTLSAPPNLPPASVTGFSGSGTETSLNFSWTAPSDTDLSQYEVRYGTTPITENSFVNETQAVGAPLPIPTTSQSFSIGGLSSATTYYVGIRVTDTVGNNSPIAVTSITTATKSGGGGSGNVSAPSPVSSFSALGRSTSAILSWHTPDERGLSEFDVRYSLTPITEGNFSSAIKVNTTPLPLEGKNQSLDVLGLSPFTTYYFGVKTVNTVGMVSTLVTASTTTGAWVPPVTNLVATASATTLDVSWHTPTSTILSVFDVRFAPFVFTAPTFASGTLATGMPLPLENKDQGFRISGLSAGTNYTIGVRIVSTTGEASDIVFISVTTPTVGGNSIGGGGGVGWGGGAMYYNPALPYMVINNDATSTDRELVTLSLSSPLVREMLISNRSDFVDAKWEPFASSSQWVLIGGSGIRTVYAKFKDQNNAISSVVSDSIMLQPFHAVPVRTPARTSSPRPVSVITPGKPFATLISIYPTQITVIKGDLVTITLVARPETSKKYGAQIELSYPSELLELRSVEYARGWKPAYDEENNYDDVENGIIHRVIAYPAGFTEPLRVMSLTFFAREDGAGLVKTTNGITLLLRNNKTALRMETKLSVVPPSGTKNEHLFANILSATTGSNLVSFVSVLSFFSILSIIYFTTSKKKSLKDIILIGK